LRYFLHFSDILVASQRGHEIILYWGQNTARRPEKSLDFFCKRGHYDVIVLNYVTEFFGSPKSKSSKKNIALLPRTDLSQ